jgi:hypothetical protein
MSEMTVAFPSDKPSVLAWLNSSIHYAWAVAHASTLETRIRYTPSDVFETLPQPAMDDVPELDQLGKLLDVTRSRTMLDRQLGLTKLYNAVHDSSVHDVEIQQLRELHEQIDHAVAAAYGWTDLRLAHGFHQTRQGLRWTLNAAVNTELLDRLLELNHERHAAEGPFAIGSPRTAAAMTEPVADALF